MELNLVPLLEAVKGITWQGVAVIAMFLATLCYMARLRLLNSREEREWHAKVSPEVAMARAATAATLPKLTKVPTSPAVPGAMLIVFLGCTLLHGQPGPAPSILQAHRAKQSPASEFDSDLWLSSAQASPRGELARVGTGDPGTTPAPGRTAPGPVKKDCDSTWCKPPSRCSRGECVQTARKPPPTKMAGQLGPSSFAVRAAWQDTEPEPFPERQSDAQWLAATR